MTSQYLRFVVRPPEDVVRLVDGMHAYGRYLHGAGEGMMHVEADSESADLIVHPASRPAMTNGTGVHAVIR